MIFDNFSRPNFQKWSKIMNKLSEKMSIGSLRSPLMTVLASLALKEQYIPVGDSLVSLMMSMYIGRCGIDTFIQSLYTFSSKAHTHTHTCTHTHTHTHTSLYTFRSKAPYTHTRPGHHILLFTTSPYTHTHTLARAPRARKMTLQNGS